MCATLELGERCPLCKEKNPFSIGTLFKSTVLMKLLQLQMQDDCFGLTVGNNRKCRRFCGSVLASV